MSIIEKLKDKTKRRTERCTPLGYQYVFADSIDFINSKDWDVIASISSIFLGRDYLKTIETYSPKNTCQRYAIAYSEGKPVVIMACQIATINANDLLLEDDELKRTLAGSYKERILVCGNLVSSGLHGVAFAESLVAETGWRIVAEAMYKIRRSEKLNGKIDFAVVKDIKGADLQKSEIMERYSYRRIQTDPDMVLELDPSLGSFEAYLGTLNTKYRSRIKKVISTLEQAQFTVEKLSVIDDSLDQQLHHLYLEVERKSAIRPATLPAGYFSGLSRTLGEKFICSTIMKNEEMAGFVTVIKDGTDAIAYYVGIDYAQNTDHPIYFRLLQLAIEAAFELNCQRVHFGRTALEPKANLGAKPVPTYVWARHRIPIVNLVVRKLFNQIPFDTAPERQVAKQ